MKDFIKHIQVMMVLIIISLIITGCSSSNNKNTANASNAEHDYSESNTNTENSIVENADSDLLDLINSNEDDETSSESQFGTLKSLANSNISVANDNWVLCHMQDYGESSLMVPFPKDGKLVGIIDNSNIETEYVGTPIKYEVAQENSSFDTILNGSTDPDRSYFSYGIKSSYVEAPMTIDSSTEMLKYGSANFTVYVEYNNTYGAVDDSEVVTDELESLISSAESDVPMSDKTLYSVNDDSISVYREYLDYDNTYDTYCSVTKYYDNESSLTVSVSGLSYLEDNGMIESSKEYIKAVTEYILSAYGMGNDANSAINGTEFTE